MIRNLETKCFISIASVWEITIKLSLGKLDMNGGFSDISEILQRYEIELLPLTFEHIEKLLTLDYHHRDPFDRIIISHGVVENLFVITKDENFAKYNTDFHVHDLP